MHRFQSNERWSLYNIIFYALVKSRKLFYFKTDTTLNGLIYKTCICDKVRTFSSQSRPGLGFALRPTEAFLISSLLPVLCIQTDTYLTFIQIFWGVFISLLRPLVLKKNVCQFPLGTCWLQALECNRPIGIKNFSVCRNTWGHVCGRMPDHVFISDLFQERIMLVKLKNPRNRTHPLTTTELKQYLLHLFKTKGKCNKNWTPKHLGCWTR